MPTTDAQSLNVTASLLVSRQGSFLPTFSPFPIFDRRYFNDGPAAPLLNATAESEAPGSLSNLSSSSPFVQGVEITRSEQYAAGLVKIWSGEPGHRLAPGIHGQDGSLFDSVTFTDSDRFSAGQYVEAQQRSSPLWSAVFSYPLVVGGGPDQVDTAGTNVIEPLTIRSVAGCYSTYVPVEPHTPKGAVMSGNEDISGRSDMQATVVTFRPAASFNGFLDSGNARGRLAVGGLYQLFEATREPFNDVRYTRNEGPTPPAEAALASVMSLMTGSTGGYVRFDQVSSTCGWCYDGTAGVGTDSLAFGGMTH